MEPYKSASVNWDALRWSDDLYKLIATGRVPERLMPSRRLMYTDDELINLPIVPAKFNNTQLTALLHKSIHEIDTLLRDFQQDIHKEKLLLGTDSDEKGNFKDNQNSWHGNDKAGQNTPDATFLSTPEAFGVTNNPTAAASIKNLRTGLNSLPGVFYKPPRSTSYKPLPGFDSPSFFPPELQFNSFDYDGTLEPVTSKDFEVSSPYLPSLAETSPPTAPSLVEGTFMPFPSVHPPIQPELRGFTISKYFKTSRDTNMKVDKARTGDTPVQKRIKGNPITPEPHPLARTLSKAQAWVQNRRWTTTLTTGSGSSASSSEAAQALRTLSGETLSTDTANTALFHEDEQGFLYVSIPASLPTTISTPSTVAGDVLFAADRFTTAPESLYISPNKPFHDIMNATDEGHVVVFISELARLVVLKEENEMQQVIGHAEPIMNKLLEENMLGFAGRPIQTAATRLTQMLTDGYFDAGPLKSSAVFLRLILNERDTTLSPEVNALIDYTDMLFDNAKGEPLFDALRDFEDFPNSTTSTAYQVCYNLLTRFIEPFRELPKTERGQALLDSMNKAILDRFGQRKVGYRKRGGKAMRGGATPKLDISRLNQRNTLSLKRRISKIRRELNRTRNQNRHDNHRRQYYYQTPWIPILRSMLPITRHQKRFRVITPRQLWITENSNERRTQDYRRRLSRPTHPPNDMMQFFPRVRVERQRASRSPPPIVAVSVEKHSKQANGLQKKNNLM